MQGFEINTPYNLSNLSLHSSLHHTTQSSVQESVRPSVQQNLSTGTQKQYASPPGTVLHSTDPSVFKVDAVYNMPDEKVCLKKGGNGVIFLVKYGSKEYAVKKTAYRSREFNIHKKLKHPNVIELCLARNNHCKGKDTTHITSCLRSSDFMFEFPHRIVKCFLNWTELVGRNWNCEQSYGAQMYRRRNFLLLLLMSAACVRYSTQYWNTTRW